jgi:hypothetical protein
VESKTIETIERTSLDELFSAPRNERNASDVESSSESDSDEGGRKKTYVSRVERSVGNQPSVVSRLEAVLFF